MEDRSYQLIHELAVELAKAESYVLQCKNMNAYNKIERAILLTEELADELFPIIGEGGDLDAK